MAQPMRKPLQTKYTKTQVVDLVSIKFETADNVIGNTNTNTNKYSGLFGNCNGSLTQLKFDI